MKGFCRTFVAPDAAEIKRFCSFPPAFVGLVLVVFSPPLVWRVTAVFGGADHLTEQTKH